MNNKYIHQTLRSIEETGNIPNRESLEKAYFFILQYLAENRISIDGYNFSSSLDNYSPELIESITDLHHSIYNFKHEKHKNIPLEVFLFFKTIDKVFHLSEPKNNQKVVYVDMDGVIVDFVSAFQYYDADFLKNNPDKDEIEGIFSKMHPMNGAIESLDLLYRHYDVFILSSSPWHNPSAWKDKIEWVQKYLPIVGYKRLILSHHKNLNWGDYLIDDRLKNGVAGFKGKHIHFGSEDFPDWAAVRDYLMG